MYLILNCINQLLNSILYIILALFILTPRLSRIKSTAILMLFDLLLVVVKFKFYSDLTIPMITATTFQISYYLFLIIVFKESPFKKALVFISTITPALMSEYTALMLNNILFHADFDSLSPKTKEFFIINTIALIAQIIMSVLIIFIWKAISRKKSASNLFYFIIMPVILLLLTVAIFAPFIIGDTALNPAVLSICISFSVILCIILFYYVLRNNEKKTIEEAYEELQHLYAMDLEYYRELENRHEELAKLRHDYQNQLATLYMLISSGKTDAAKEFVSALHESLL